MTVPAARIRDLTLPACLGFGGLLLATSPALAQMPHVEFQPFVSYELSNSEPRCIAVGEINNDGREDIIIALSGSDSSQGLLTVLFGDGHGALVDSTDFASTHQWWGVATGDFNGDHRLDIVAAAGGSEVTAVNVYAGNGNGGFAPMANLNAGRFPIATVVGDWNGDGFDDLGVANNVTRGVSIILGNGDGTFQPVLHVPGAAGLLATDVCKADFNRDGKLDLAVSHYSGVTVFAGEEGGGLWNHYADTGGPDLKNRIAAGDINGDGIPDIITAEQHNNRIIICLGNGVDGFTTGTPYSTGGNVLGVAVSDLNRDGHNDVCVATSDSTGAEVFLNSGDGAGTLLPRVEFAAGPQPTAIAATDLNRDGFDDLMITCRNSGQTPSVSVLLQVPQLSLAVDADCPEGGTMRLTWVGATPNEAVALLYAAERGSYVIHSGSPCAGTTLGLGAAQLRVAYRGTAGPRGTRTIATNVSRSICGNYLQLLDASTCTTSNVATIR